MTKVVWAKYCAHLILLTGCVTAVVTVIVGAGHLIIIIFHRYRQGL